MTDEIVKATAELGSAIASGAYALTTAASALVALTNDGRAEAAKYFLSLAYWKTGDVGWDVSRRGLTSQPSSDTVSAARAKLAQAIAELRETLALLENVNVAGG